MRERVVWLTIFVHNNFQKNIFPLLGKILLFVISFISNLTKKKRINYIFESNVKIPNLIVRISDHQGDLSFFAGSKFDCIFFVFDVADINATEPTPVFDKLWKSFMNFLNQKTTIVS